MAAETISFADGAFDLGVVTDRDGTTNLDVLVQDNSFRLFNDDGSTIVGLGLLAEDRGLRLFIGNIDAPPSTVAVTDSDLTLTGDRSRLEIAGSGKRLNVNTSGESSRFIVDGRLAKSTINADDSIIMRFKGIDIEGTTVRGTEINLSAQNDKVVFGGFVRNTTINDLGGDDLIRFKGDIRNTSINLSEDSAATIRLDSGVSFESFRINGADSDDVLFIGSSEYRFEGGRTWVNIEDADDTLRL
jgi:hypothetical protein